MSDKHNAAYHPLPAVYECDVCTARYATPSAAETCAEQDDVEDRDTRRIYRSSN